MNSYFSNKLNKRLIINDVQEYLECSFRRNFAWEPGLLPNGYIIQKIERETKTYDSQSQKYIDEINNETQLENGLPFFEHSYYEFWEIKDHEVIYEGGFRKKNKFVSDDFWCLDLKMQIKGESKEFANILKEYKRRYMTKATHIMRGVVFFAESGNPAIELFKDEKIFNKNIPYAGILRSAKVPDFKDQEIHLEHIGVHEVSFSWDLTTKTSLMQAILDLVLRLKDFIQKDEVLDTVKSERLDIDFKMFSTSLDTIFG